METFRHLYMPYCLTRLQDGSYLPLNRHYKPLGIHPSIGWVDYQTYPARRVSISP